MTERILPEGFRFCVPGIPRGQGRPRFARIGSFVRTYDPAQSRSYKATVAQFAQAAGVRPIDGPVTLQVDAYLPRPKRLCRKRDSPTSLPATCRPDWDNIGKIVADALIGVAYADDAQVAEGHVRKLYHEVGGMPRIEVTVMQGRMPDGNG